jgi:hypothetical protein
MTCIGHGSLNSFREKALGGYSQTKNAFWNAEVFQRLSFWKCDGNGIVRYYFDIDDHRQISDHEGSECHNIEEARNHALRLAEKMGFTSTPRDHRGSFVRVVDEMGVEVFRTQIR